MQVPDALRANPTAATTSGGSIAGVSFAMLHNCNINVIKNFEKTIDK